MHLDILIWMSIKKQTGNKEVSSMFSNIGNKLKTAAKILLWAGIAVSAIGGIAMIASGSAFRSVNPMILPGLITMIGGALLAWISALGLYGFGELVENSDIRTNIAAKQDMEREQEKKNADRTM